jgi:hypothetical protein
MTGNFGTVYLVKTQKQYNYMCKIYSEKNSVY